MSLLIRKYNIKSANFGDRWDIEGPKLTLNKEELLKIAEQASEIRNVEVELAFPGEQTRIINALDSVAPITKPRNGSGVFPGFLSPLQTVGFGVTHLLSGVLVLAIGEFPQQVQGVLSPRLGLIEMGGPGTRYSAGSDHINLVLSFSASPAMSNDLFAQGIRKATLTTAKILADLTLTREPDDIEEYDLSSSYHDLPRVACICQLQNQGPLVETFLYGSELGRMLPTAMDPLETFDGAIVSGNFKGFMKIPTHLHSRNPVMLELCRKHGKELNFVALIVSRGHHESYELKARSAHRVAKLAKLLRCDGAVLSMEGTGNATIDYMLTLQACEREGIRVVGIMHEHSGLDGRGFPLVDFVPEATTLVSSGNKDFPIFLPTPERVIGAEWLKLAGRNDPVEASDSLSVTVNDMYGSYQAMAMNGFKGFDF